MKNNSFNLVSSVLSGVLASMLVACSVANNNINKSTLEPNLSGSKNVLSQISSKYSVSGKIGSDYGFKTKASFSDLVSGASVSLLDLANNAQSSSFNTASDGTFSVLPNNSFVPVLNQIYVLEAVKRVSSTNIGPLLSLRTYVQWNGTSFTSITGSNVVLNTYTTALVVLSSNGVIRGVDTIGKISIAGGVSTPSAIAPIPAAGLAPSFVGADLNKINTVTRLVQNSINFQKDPLQSVMMNGAGNFVIDLNDLQMLSNNGVGSQVDRLGLPSLNIAINGYNGFTKAVYTSLGHSQMTRDLAKNAYNMNSPKDDVANYRGFWGTAISAVFNRPAATGTALATALTPDVYTINMASTTSFAALNGRKLSDDVIDVELQLLSGAPTATDAVSANDKAFTTTFPYLAAPF